MGRCLWPIAFSKTARPPLYVQLAIVATLSAFRFPGHDGVDRPAGRRLNDGTYCERFTHLLIGQTLMQATKEILGRRGRLVQAIRDYFKQCYTCRECGSRVSLMSDYCPACGSSLPSILPVSPPVLVTALGCLAAVLVLKLNG